MSVLGAKGSLNDAASPNAGIMYTDRRDFYLNPKEVKELYPSVTPFLSFAQKRKMKKTNDPDYKMFEHRSKWYDMKWTQNAATAANLVVGTETVALAIDGLNGVMPYVGLMIDIHASNGTKKAQAIVTTVLSSSSIKVTPVYVVGSPSTADNDIHFVVGHAAEEGSGSPDAWADDLEIAYNSAGIFKTPVEITGTLYKLALRGYSSELKRLRDEKSKEHRIKVAKAIYFSRRKGGLTDAPSHISGSHAIRTTHGIIPSIEDYNSGSNVLAVDSASYNYDAFVDHMQTVFQYSNDQAVKYAFVGDSALAFWSKLGDNGFLANASVQIGPTEKKFGFNVRTLETPFGILRLVRDPLLTKTNGGLYAGKMVIVDPDNISTVTYRSDSYQTAIQDNDVDGIKDQYFSDVGLGVTLPETHFVMDVS